jgi:hypothetical protein
MSVQRDSFCKLNCSNPYRRFADTPKPPWSQTDLDRLREVYQAEGMAGCVLEFEGRTYQALACALRRHKITAGQRRAEAMAG